MKLRKKSNQRDLIWLWVPFLLSLGGWEQLRDCCVEGGLNVLCQILQVLWARHGFKVSLTEISGKHWGSHLSQSSSFRGTIPQWPCFLCPPPSTCRPRGWGRAFSLGVRELGNYTQSMSYHVETVILKCSWANQSSWQLRFSTGYLKETSQARLYCVKMDSALGSVLLRPKCECVCVVCVCVCVWDWISVYIRGWEEQQEEKKEGRKKRSITRGC